VHCEIFLDEFIVSKLRDGNTSKNYNIGM
jgi:hypothetical protein